MPITLSPMERPTMPDEEIVAQARDRLALIDSRESNYRIRARDEWHFSHGRQWDETVQREREGGIGGAQPCLVVNMVEAMITKLENEFRQNRPASNVLPIDSVADIDTAEIIQGMLRDIERQSHVDMPIDTMVDHLHRVGRGFMRICIDFDGPESFDKVPRVKPIPHWESVYLDPFHQLGDGSDAKYGLITQDVPKDEFTRMYPKARPINFGELARMDSFRLWFRDQAVRIAEYFFIEERTVEIARLKDGQVRRLVDVSEEGIKNGLVVETRETNIPQIWHVLMNGQEVLQSKAQNPFAWPGQHIPIVECIGIEDEIEGQRAYKGFTHNTIGPQQAYNYFVSTSAEISGNMPRAPWIAPRGSFVGMEKQWREANRKNFPYLEYEPVIAPNGQIAPPPQRQIFDAPIDKLMQQRFVALEDLRAVTGMQPSRGASPMFARSGEAEREQQSQTDMTNFHLMSNATRSVRRMSEILVDLVVKLYTREQVIRILGEDGEPEQVTINGKSERNGQTKFFDLQAGRYDVATSTGPSFATKRQEGAKGMVELVSAHPPFAAIVGDIMVEDLDMPRAKEAAARIKRTIDPNVLGEEELSPEQLQSELAQAQTEFKQLEAYAVERERDIKRLQAELETAELRIEDKMQSHTVDLARLDLDRDKLQHQIDIDGRELAVDVQTKNRKLAIDEAEVALDAAQGG